LSTYSFNTPESLLCTTSCYLSFMTQLKLFQLPWQNHFIFLISQRKSCFLALWGRTLQECESMKLKLSIVQTEHSKSKHLKCSKIRKILNVDGPQVKKVTPNLMWQGPVKKKCTKNTVWNYPQAMWIRYMGNLNKSHFQAWV
jgi:hypothetical protein